VKVHDKQFNSYCKRKGFSKPNLHINKWLIADSVTVRNAATPNFCKFKQSACAPSLCLNSLCQTSRKFCLTKVKDNVANKMQTRGVKNVFAVITEPCVGVKDGACVQVCPVECIYEGDDQFYIHPNECICCTACFNVCPTGAIFALDEVPANWQHFIQKAQRHFGV
jgi:NAD-dependent dihydropyrimidine dehydrogenase PreA subunit